MTDEEHPDAKEFESRRGNDTTPLISMVRDKQYSRGMLTSQGRTASRAYQEFLERNRGRKR